MTTETARPKKTTTNGDAQTTQDVFGSMWGTTLDMQRQWMDMWTRPLGFTATPDQTWREFHKLSTEFLDLNRKTSELTHEFVNDQVKMGRQFTDKALDMKWNTTEREPKETAPEFARELFETARRSAKRAFTFGNESLKTIEEFGLNASETMTRVPTEKK